MSRICLPPPTRAQEMFAWLLEAVKLAPVGRKLTSEITAMWEQITDPNVPSWQSALVLTALLEAVACLPVQLPILWAVRFVLVKAFLEARKLRKERPEPTDEQD